MPAQVKNTTITLTDRRRFKTTLQMNSQHCYSYYTKDQEFYNVNQLLQVLNTRNSKRRPVYSVTVITTNANELEEYNATND